MKIHHAGHTMTLANSIIGVGILAMPFCFYKCGIVLSILLLIFNNLVTRVSCYYLIKSSLYTRRRSFEFLGFYAFGSSGKLIVELCIIGYLIGTCIAYFVVVGDLGPMIIANLLDLNMNDNLRTCVMVFVTIVCIIPLGLLKNVESLHVVSAASIGFYICLVLKLIIESKFHLIANDWFENVTYWDSNGILQCLPIFSMASSCQMQLFEVMETVPNPSQEKMNSIVKQATKICTSVYILVGFFGYVGFSSIPLTGNILINLSPTISSQIIKMGFVLSVAFSFPLVIFPCRVSIYSLIYKRGHGDASTYIPEKRFKLITIAIICTALFIALVIPSIELVIGIVGSTIGVAICIMFPASLFLKIFSKIKTIDRTVAQIMLIGGFCLMILGTYANLNAIDEQRSGLTLDVTDIPKLQRETFHENDFVINKIAEKDIENSLNLINPSKELLDKEKLNLLKIQDSLIENTIKKEVLSKIQADTEQENKNLITNKKPSDQKSDVATGNIKISKVPSKLEEKNNLTYSINIDKDAIKKDEEIALEEQDNKKDTQLKQAEEELKKTKELLEKKVDELKQEIVKQNEETQKLVNEKLSDIIDQVKEIKVEVNEEKNLFLKNEINKNEKNIAVQDPKITNIIKNNSVEGKITVDNEIIKDNSSVKINFNSNITRNNIQEKQNNLKIEKVFEPLSYKTGEILNKMNETEIKLNSLLPIPLLMNMTNNRNHKNTQDKKNPTQLNSEKQINDNKKSNDQINNIETENNVDSIRRDILEVKNSISIEKVKLSREKRELKNFNNFECFEKDSNKKIDALIDNFESKINHNLELLKDYHTLTDKK